MALILASNIRACLTSWNIIYLSMDINIRKSIDVLIRQPLGCFCYNMKEKCRYDLQNFQMQRLFRKSVTALGYDFGLIETRRNYQAVG